MKAAYVDTSWIVAIAFAEKGYERLVRSLRSYDVILTSNLLETELRPALQRAGRRGPGGAALRNLVDLSRSHVAR